MKKSLYLTAALLLGAAFTSCQDDYENVGDNNRVYDSATENISTFALDGKLDESSRSLSALLAQPAGYDVTITYGVDPNGVADYNSMYGQEAILLPEEYWEIPEPTTEISKGEIASGTVTVNFKNLKQLDQENVHVLPVRIMNSTIPALASRNTQYFVFRGAALINVVGGLRKTCLTFINEGQTPALSGLRKFTFEALVYPEAFDRTLSTLMGIEGSTLIRIGDAGIPSNQIQFARGSNASDAAWQLEIGKWTFITLTYDGDNGNVEVYFDGVKKGSTQSCGSSGSFNWNVSSADRACYIGYSYDTDRYFDGRISEVRVWNKILTPADITARNHMYRVDTDADGLVGYWKFDEGEGNLVHDYANGYDMQVPVTYPGKTSNPGDLQWYPVTMP